MSTDPKPRMTDGHDPEIAEYRLLNGWAVAGLIFGLLGPSAMIDPLLWLVPLVGIGAAGLALRQIARGAPEIVGRKVALWGLSLSILFGVAAPANWFGYRWLVRGEARQFAAAWFEFLGHDQPHKAYQLTRHPDYRQPLDDRLWKLHRGDPHWEGQLIAYVARPLVHTLLALGEKAQARYYETAHEDYTGQNKEVLQVYAVTYDDGGQKKTFFVALEMERIQLKSGVANWRLASTRHDLVPEELRGVSRELIHSASK